MAIQVACGCGATIEVPERLAGRSGKCAKCGARVNIPGLASARVVDSDADRGDVDSLIRASQIDPAEYARRQEAPEPDPWYYRATDFVLFWSLILCAAGFILSLMAILIPLVTNPRGSAPEDYPARQLGMAGTCLLWAAFSCAGLVVLDMARNIRKLARR